MVLRPLIGPRDLVAEAELIRESLIISMDALANQNFARFSRSKSEDWPRLKALEAAQEKGVAIILAHVDAEWWTKRRDKPLTVLIAEALEEPPARLPT
jgi:hypothetical protein